MLSIAVPPFCENHIESPSGPGAIASKVFGIAVVDDGRLKVVREICCDVTFVELLGKGMRSRYPAVPPSVETYSVHHK